ncbi:tyrosine-protein kinase receptor Tie-2-like [Strongylocentrotus purpuratus]|uniref:Uncharacterized protein n=1 Tax=Strongylocentrotus purpuratus TaxID=7668 RepID=A0A7M7PMW7_STRPU|nr:tyrosine-protein kinase receptor Tie-2-like [Strongylocentrotus purpuratus]
MREVIHITVLTRSYTNVDTSSFVEYQCWRSEPDRDALLSFGRSAPITTNRSPPEDKQYPSNGFLYVRLVTFPTGDGWDRDGFGPFHCEASKPDRDVTRVTTFFQRSDAKFISRNGLFTKTVNVNDTGVRISMTTRHNADASDNVITWMKDGSEVLTFDGQTQISFPNPIQTSDQGIYEIYYDNERNQNRGGLYRLIVRECPAGKWGPPECDGICDKCYNGGVCDDKSGLCICPNNFKGPNCLEICRTFGGNRFGLNCEFRCEFSSAPTITRCHGFLFCLPDPYGCSCDVGARGLACNTRISRLVPVRVNPYQPSSFTCYVEGTPLPRKSSVDLYRRTGSTVNRTGITRRSSTVSGSERAVVFDVDSVYPQEYGGYVCILYVENEGYPITAYTSATYDLPVIEKAPVIVSTTSTTVGLRWNAWSAEDDKGDPPLVGYDVFVKKDGVWVTDQRVDQLTTSAIVSNLIPDTDYRFRVAAVREGTGGTGPFSQRNNTITRCKKPSASPPGINVAAINAKELEVTWEHLPSELAECRSGVTQYMIYYASTGSASLNSLMVSNDTSSYTLRGLDTYLNYTIQLTASNKDEESDGSSETIGKTLEEVAPSPTNVAITQSTTSSFTVSWSTPLPSNINGNIQKYVIRYKRTDPAGDGNYKMEEVLTGEFDGEYTVMDQASEISYTVQVRTVNGAGSSNWSEPVNARTILSVNTRTILSGDDSVTRIPLGAVVGGAIVPLIIIVILISIVVLYRRIKQRRLNAEPAASPPNTAHKTSSKDGNPVFDDSDTNTYQDPYTDTTNNQNLTDAHAYLDPKKPNINITDQDATKSDPGGIYEEI